MDKKFLTALTLAALGFGLMMTEVRAETENPRIQEQRNMDVNREARPPMREGVRAPTIKSEGWKKCVSDSDCSGQSCCSYGVSGSYCASSCW